MPQRMRDGIINAVNGWNTALNVYGPDIGPRLGWIISDVQCSGPYCINTEVGQVNLSNECALANVSSDPNTGVITSSTITFPTQSATWNQSFNDRLAGHELGHHLGLANNNTSYGAINSLMKPVGCNQSSGYPVQPTTSDSWPVMQSIYQNGTKTVCR